MIFLVRCSCPPRERVEGGRGGDIDGGGGDGGGGQRDIDSGGGGDG